MNKSSSNDYWGSWYWQTKKPLANKAGKSRKRNKQAWNCKTIIFFYWSITQWNSIHRQNVSEWMAPCVTCELTPVYWRPLPTFIPVYLKQIESLSRPGSSQPLPSTAPGVQTLHPPVNVVGCSHFTSLAACAASSSWELSENMLGLWSGVPGRSLIYSLNSGLAPAGRDGSEVTGWDRVSVIPEAPRRSGSPAGKNSYEENNVSVRMPVKCVMVMRTHVFSFLQT